MANLNNANNVNLEIIASSFIHLPYFLLFGSLLGLTRENQLISNDDDIDFGLHVSHKEETIEILNKLKLKVKEKNYAVSAENLNLKSGNNIDFYFYFEKNGNLVFPATFYNNCKYKRRHDLYIPKNYVFDLKSNNGVNIPNKSLELSKYLYGKNFEKNLIKNKDYFIFFIRNKPVIIYNKFFIKILFLNRLFFEKRYKYFFNEIRTIFKNIL